MDGLIIDAHQHFWNLDRFTYPWMSSELGVLFKNYLPGNLEPILAANGVDRTVLVQAQHSLAETRWFLELADQNEFIAAVVGWVDLTAPDLPAVLDDLAQHARFRGVRHQIQDEADDDWILREDVLQGLGELSTRGLTYDLLLHPRHLKHVPRVAESLPDLKFVIDHLAKPPIASGRLEPWAKELRRAAQYPNVYCKLSGMITEADWNHWTPDDLRPYVQTAVEAFGYERLMFGSDWPVCLLAGSYERVLAGLRQALGPLDLPAEGKVFGGNAAQFYGIKHDNRTPS